MNLLDLEDYINFTLISDVNDKKKRRTLDIRRLEHVLSSKGVTLGGFHYFTPEMSNGKLILEEQPCHIMNAQSFKRFMQLLTDKYSDEFNGVFDCLNNLIQQNPTAYHYLLNSGRYRIAIYRQNLMYYPLFAITFLKNTVKNPSFGKYLT